MASSIWGLAFPYKEVENSKTRLSTLILTDDQDTCRFCITIKDRKCNNIEKLYTRTKQPIEGPLKYVSHSSDTNPLLLSVPPQFRKLKLQLTVSQTTKEIGNSLTILKTYGDDNNADVLREYLLLNDYTASSRDISEISLAEFILSDDPETVVVNDTFESQTLSNQTLNVSLWERTSSGIHFVLSFQLWIEELKVATLAPSTNKQSIAALQTNTAEVKGSSITIPELRKAYSFNIEDGPEFRSTLHNYEQHIPKFKKTLQSFQDEARIVDSTIRRLTKSRLKLLEIIDSLIDLQFNPLLPKLKLVKRLARQFLLMFDPIEHNVGQLLQEVFNVSVVPKLLSYFIPVIPSEGSEHSSSKKVFERHSRDYYEWLNKYLSNEKDRPELKLLLKRKAFELSKFDYLNTLNVATNNQYFNQLLENILKFSNMKVTSLGLFDFKAYKDAKSSHNLLSSDDALYLNSLSRFNSEKLQLRQLIETCRTNEELTNLIRNNSLNPGVLEEADKLPPGNTEAEKTEATGVKLDLVFPGNNPASSVLSPSNASSPIDGSGQMSGILYALGGKGKPGWHKEWVVLRDGQLMEFSDWRKGRQPINKPIDIALSNIKATTHDKRQFCFEIITSKNQKHVFQAMSNEERNKWMKSLYNAGQITLNLAEPLSKSRRRPRVRTKFDLQLPPQVLSPNEFHRLSSPVSLFSTSRLPKTNVDCLELVRSIEGSKNDTCADCGSTDSVEWVSSNVLVVLCVQCSSCHRHMGSHISKVRSLRLDNFSDESLVLLEYVNNAEVNGYLQDNTKQIGEGADDEQRLSFIQKKYIQKAFMVPFPDADSALVQAVRKIDIHGVIKCLNSGADPNLRLQVGPSTPDSEPTVVSLFEYSLRKAVKLDENSTSKDFFVISELLLLHGCNIEHIESLHSIFKYSDEARAYWEKRCLRVV